MRSASHGGLVGAASDQHSRNCRSKERTMSLSHSDALVFFGTTGDLAYKKIFPSLQAMVKRGRLNVPVIGVAKAGWDLDQFRARARDSVEKHGGLDPAAFDTLCGLHVTSTGLQRPRNISRS